MKTHVPELVGCSRNSSKREIHSNKRLHSVQFSSSVMSDSLRPHGFQHARPPCPSPTPGVYSNSCPLSWWCQPTISSSVVPLSSLLQSSPASGSFQMSQLIASGGQSTGVSASNEYSGLISFSMDWLDLLAAQGTLKSLLQNKFKNINFSALSFLYWRRKWQPTPLFFFFLFFFICGGFCHTLKWNSHGFTCVPHPNPPSHLPLHPFPLGFPSAPGPSACLMHPTWAGDLFHPR